jgi:hypothetical protein
MNTNQIKRTLTRALPCALVAAAFLAPLASSAAAAPASFLAVSDDGSRALFSTTEALVPGDTDFRIDVYERAGGITRLLSTGPTGGNSAFDATFGGASSDGLRVFFTTSERLVPGDTDNARDVYLRTGGATTLISTGPAGGNGDADADITGITDDGTLAFFVTNEQLTSADQDTSFDIYSRSDTTTELISTGPGVGNGPHTAVFNGASADGSEVVFTTSEQMDVADTDLRPDIYMRTAGTTSLVSIGPNGGNGAIDPIFFDISTDGTKVFFETNESLVTADTDSAADVYERDGSTTALVSAGGVASNAANYAGSSADGSRVFFETDESLSGADVDSVSDVYERFSGTTTLISTGPSDGPGAFPAFFRAASTDGARVIFSTAKALTAADVDSFADVYETSGGTTILISAGTAGLPAFFSQASADGSSVFFLTQEELSGSDTDSQADVYRVNGGTTLLISTGPGVTGGNGPFDPQLTGISTDGSKAFLQTQERLTADDLENEDDIFERSGSTTMLVSIGNSAPLGPGVPVLTGSSPASPANANSPLIVGQSDPGTTLKLYSSANCTGAPVATGTAAELASPGIQVTVADDSSTNFRAQATDSLGDTSTCSPTSVTYVEDSLAPGPPDLTATDPGSPANDNTPLVKGDAEAGSTVSLYSTDDCSGAAAATGSAAAFASPGIQVTVADESTTVFRARATDAAGNVSACSSGSISYQEVSSAPAAPALAAFGAASPANQNSVHVKGAAPAGSTVEIFKGPCTGAPAATGTAAELAGAGIAVSVVNDSTTTFRATATRFGVESPCSNGVTFVEDSTRPGTPRLDVPSAPRNDNSLRIEGTAEVNSTVKLYRQASCGGAPALVLAAGELGSGVVIQVPDNSVTTLYALAVDRAGNDSACSSEPAVYTEDSAAPRTRITFAPGVKTRDRTPTFRFRDVTGNEHTRFLCKLDRRKFRSCGTPLRLRKLGPGRHTFRVKAVDSAGNREKRASKRRFTVVRTR